MSNVLRASVQVEGGNEIAGVLSNVSKQLRNSILRRAINAAVLPCLRGARSNAKSVVNQAAPGDQMAQLMKSTGTLARSMGRKVKIYPSGIAVGIVGPRNGMGRAVTLKSGRQLYMDPVHYSHLVEFGTHRSRAKPFLRPAWESSKGQARLALESTIRDGIDKAAAKGKR